MNQDQARRHYEHLDERQLRDSIAKAEAHRPRVEREGSPGARAAQREREKEVRATLAEFLQERRKGTPSEGLR